MITAVNCGHTTITVRADDCIKTVTVNVPLIESKIPATIKIGDQTFAYKSPTTNKIKDGSFEYGYFSEWMTAKDTAMTSKYFSLSQRLTVMRSPKAQSAWSGPLPRTGRSYSDSE